jgi:L-asparaginase
VHQSLLTALNEAQAHGVVVRLVTRCAEGQIVGQPAALQLAPLGLNAYKARVSLMLDLMK